MIEVLKRCSLFSLLILTLCGCASIHKPGEVFSGCPALYEGVRDDAKLHEQLSAARTGADLLHVFGQEATASCVDSTGVEWKFWYATQEWPEGGTWHWKTFLMTVTLKDGRIQSFSDPIDMSKSVGSRTWNDECLWCYYRNVHPLLSSVSDQMTGYKFFFNETAHRFVKDKADKVVDHWDGNNVVWKLPSLPRGYTRLYATNSVGMAVYYDMKPGWRYKGFSNDVFLFDPPPCAAGFKRIHEGDKFVDIPEDAVYIGYYDGVFHYRTREQEEARKRRQAAEDNALIASAVMSGISSAVQGFQSYQAQQISSQMVRQKSHSSKQTTLPANTTNSTKKKFTGITYQRPRCSKHDCELDGCGHCPVCNAGFLEDPDYKQLKNELGL